MTVRSGFVTNSSSSSFIVSAKDSVDDKLKFVIEVDLNKLANKKLRTIEDLNYYIKSNFDFDPEDPEREPWFQDRYDKMKEAIKAGNVVYTGYASNESDDAIEQLIYYNGFKYAEFPEGAELIYGEIN